MRKKYENITSILLLIVGLVIFSHSIIPHDHHYNSSVSDIEHHHHNDNDSGDEPIHCHYFNNIDFDKVRTNNVTNIIKELPILYTVIFDEIFELDINYQVNNYINLNDNLPDYCVLISISPTRGSPLA